MCGIVGYIGEPINLDKVKLTVESLEYRGYDSVGIVGLKDGNVIYFDKNIGKIQTLFESKPKDMKMDTWLAHTRWATRGDVTKENAHPHTDCSGNIYVIHNGDFSLEYKKIRKTLEEEGHKFTSNTDTEVIAHLIEKYSKETDFLEACIKSGKELGGYFAVSIINIDRPDEIIAMKRGEPPLLIGRGEKQNVVASDTRVIALYTDTFTSMEDGDVAVIKKDSIEIFNSGKKIERDFTHIDIEDMVRDKGELLPNIIKEIISGGGIID
ncbi:MAG: class II glutamine amidotransferase [Candidatus Aenigmarchaeota archaeon]|nr:class II glutamine amidotransferase [Candidatus Aenigmarchaeota archaeon]